MYVCICNIYIYILYTYSGISVYQLASSSIHSCIVGKGVKCLQDHLN